MFVGCTCSEGQLFPVLMQRRIDTWLSDLATLQISLSALRGHQLRAQHSLALLSRLEGLLSGSLSRSQRPFAAPCMNVAIGLPAVIPGPSKDLLGQNRGAASPQGGSEPKLHDAAPITKVCYYDLIG